MKGLELVETVTISLADQLREAKEKILQLEAHIERLSARITTQSNAMRGIYIEGYSAGYAARDKLSCASCGDGGKPVDRIKV